MCWLLFRFVMFGGEFGIEQVGLLDIFFFVGYEVKCSDDVQFDVVVVYEINVINGVLSGIEVDCLFEVEIERNSNVNFERDNWKIFGGMILVFLFLL